MSGSPPDTLSDSSLDDARGRFCPWYGLADIGERAPAIAGVFQIKLMGALLSYPRGKSAMLRYGHGARLSQALAPVAAELSGHPQADRFACRHQIADDERAAEQLYRTVLDQFIARFGTPPRLPSVSPSADSESDS